MKNRERSLTSRTLRAVAVSNPALVAVLVLAIVGNVVASLAPPWILKLAIDNHLLPRDAAGLPALAALYVAAIAAAGLCDFAKEAALTALGQSVTRDIRAALMEKTARLPALFFSRAETGAIVSRFTSDVDAVNALFTGGLVGMLVDAFKIVGIVVSMALFSPSLAVGALAILPLIAWVTRLFQKRMLAAEMDNRTQTAALNGHLGESVKNIRTVKVFRLERLMGERYAARLADNFETISRINFYDAIFPPIIQIVRAVVIAALVLLATPRLHFLGITAGMIAASIELLSGLFAPIENIGMEFQGIQGAVSGLRRVNDFAREAEARPTDETITAERLMAAGASPESGGAIGDVEKGASVSNTAAGASIEFSGMSFAYAEGAEILSDIRLAVPPGCKVTFTGRTGVGKTTLFRLVMGLLEPTAGTIRINGFEARLIPNAEKKRIFGYVDQNFFLVSGTVADQVTLGDASIPREAVARAIEAVGLGEYVAALPQGLDTPVSGDGLFSQGQKQLLSIARALACDPPILLLDEMTANLDSITESRVVSALQRAGQGRTILAISHRPSSMIASDLVVILKDGKIQDAGSPGELIERDEWFRGKVELEKLVWA